MSDEGAGVFLLKVDTLKSEGNFNDAEILKRAFKAMSLRCASEDISYHF